MESSMGETILRVNREMNSSMKLQHAKKVISYLLADAGIYLNEYKDNGLKMAQLARSFYCDEDYALMREIRSRINTKREEMFRYARNN